jgi:hypothetical protein
LGTETVASGSPGFFYDRSTTPGQHSRRAPAPLGDPAYPTVPQLRPLCLGGTHHRGGELAGMELARWSRGARMRPSCFKSLVSRCRQLFGPDAMKPEPPRLWEGAPDSASKSNPAGTDGEVATFAVISAIVDSLAEPCVSHIEMP